MHEVTAIHSELMKTLSLAMFKILGCLCVCVCTEGQMNDTVRSLIPFSMRLIVSA